MRLFVVVDREGELLQVAQARDRLRRGLLGYREVAAEFRGVLGAAGDGAHGEVVDGAYVGVPAESQLLGRGIHQRAKACQQEQCEIGTRA